MIGIVYSIIWESSRVSNDIQTVGFLWFSDGSEAPWGQADAPPPCVRGTWQVGFEVTRGTCFFLQDGRSTTQNGVFSRVTSVITPRLVEVRQKSQFFVY